jgi:hypothetical protein
MADFKNRSTPSNKNCGPKLLLDVEDTQVRPSEENDLVCKEKWICP